MSEDAVAPGRLHELHNHLAAIQGFAQLCLDAADAGRPPARDHLEGIVRAADAASQALRAITGGSR